MEKIITCHICKKIAEKANPNPEHICRLCYNARQRAYNKHPKVKAKQRAYYQRPEVKERKRAYNQRQDVKEKKRIYNKTYLNQPKVKERMRAYRHNYDQQLTVKKRKLISARAYYCLNSEKVKIYHRTLTRKRRLNILIHYGGSPPKCACCGESQLEFLTIDHINGGGSKHHKETGGGSHYYAWFIKNKYPSGFQVLCFNCNCAKGIYGICPHKNTRSNR